MNDNSGFAVLGFVVFVLALAWMNRKRKKSNVNTSKRYSTNTDPKKIDPYIDIENRRANDHLNDGGD